MWVLLLRIMSMENHVALAGYIGRLPGRLAARSPDHQSGFTVVLLNACFNAVEWR